ncbi:hypothetical protein D3C79_413110 [compost metagenome]
MDYFLLIRLIGIQPALCDPHIIDTDFTFETGQLFVFQQLLHANPQFAAGRKYRQFAVDGAPAEQHAKLRWLGMLPAMPAAPDADGLRHQLNAVPARQCALRIKKGGQYAVRADCHRALSVLLAYLKHPFQQHHR